MAAITLKGNAIETVGNLPQVDSKAPELTLLTVDLGEASLSDYKGKNVVLNIFPSIDTPVCATSVRRFNADASQKENTVVLCISADLPFAHSRFCGAEGLDDVVSLSTFGNDTFGKDYGVQIATGPLKGMMSRAVVIIDAEGNVKYTEQVPEITQEPNYEAAVAAL